MTLAIVTHTVGTGDGQGRVNYEIARAALQRGHSVVLVASAVDEDLLAMQSVAWISIPVKDFPTELLRNQVFAWRSARWVRSHREDIDVLLTNGAITWAEGNVNAAHFVHSAWLRSQVHTVRTRQGPYAWYQVLYTALNALWERYAFQQANLVVAVSEQVRRDLLDIGVPDRKIRVIPNGVDLEEFSPGPQERERFTLPSDVPLGLFVGDLRTPRKNLDTVLEAMRLVPSFHLAVAGTTDGSPYPAMSREMDIDDRVHFLGYCEDIPALMRSVNVCLCPSRYEPFSLVLLEALASGCPVITTRSVGAADLLPDDAGRILEDPDDAEALASSLSTIVNPSVPILEIRNAARATAEAHSFDQMAQSYLYLIENASIL